MPSVRFQKDDFLGKTPVVPGWYTLSIGEFTESLSKDKESTNFWGEFTVSTDGGFQGMKIRHCFNEKGMKYAAGAADYVACFTTETDQLVDTEVIDVLKMTSGKTVQGYLEWDPEFRRNQIKDWRSAR